MKYDLIVHNGVVVTVNPDSDIIENGWIGVKNGVIETVSSSVSKENLENAVQTLDACNGIVMPGLINTHTHLPMSIFRGLADDLPLDQWLNDRIFPAEAKFIDPDNVRLGALLSCAELLLSGVTTICDGYFLEDSVAKSVRRAGMRAVLGQGVIDFPAPGVLDPAENIEAASAFVSKWKDVSDLISPSIFCHSPYTCSANTLIKAKAVAAKENALFQIHVAETGFEAQKIRSEKDASPVGYLHRLGVLDADTLAVHCVWVDDEDIRVLAGQKTKVSHNPESNMKLAAGVAPVSKLIDNGVCVGIGTDGAASNNNLDMFQEMDMVAKLHKVETKSPVAMNAETVLRAATIKGAKALGLAGVTGSLVPGKQADLIVLEVRSPHLVPMYNPVSHLVYTATGADVKDVFVNGKPVVKDRRVLTIDVDLVLAETAKLGKTINASLV